MKPSQARLLQVNMASKANGALMRITPLAVWGHKLSQRDLVAAAAADAQLTHPNKVCLVSSAAFQQWSFRCLAMHNHSYLLPEPRSAASTSSCTDTDFIVFAQHWLRCMKAFSFFPSSKQDCHMGILCTVLDGCCATPANALPLYT